MAAASAAALKVLIDVDAGKAAGQLALFDKQLKGAAKSADKNVAAFDKTNKQLDLFSPKMRKATTDTKRFGTASQTLAKSLGDLAKTSKGVSVSLNSTSRDTEDTAVAFDKAGNSVGGFNKHMLTTRNLVSLIKWPAMIAGVGYAAEGLSNAAAGAVSLVSALKPLAGLLAAAPSLYGAIGQAAGVIAVSGISELTGAVGGLNEKLDKESEEYKRATAAGQKFMRTLKQVQQPFEEIRKRVQQPLFRGFTQGINAAKANMDPFSDVLARTAREMGNLAKEAGEFVGRKGFGRDFEAIGKNNAQLLARLGEAGLNFADALRHVMVAAMPLVDFLGKSIVKFSEFTKEEAKAGRESGRLSDFFKETKETIRVLVPMLTNLWKGLWNIIDLGKPLGDDILETLRRITRQFYEWTESVSGQNAIKEWYRDAKKPLYELGKLIGDIGEAFFDLADDRNLASLIKTIRKEMLPVLVNVLKTGKQFGPVFIDFVSEFTQALEPFLGASGPLTILTKLLTKVLSLVNDLIDAVPTLGTVLASMVGAGAISKLFGGKGLLGGSGGIMGMLGGALGLGGKGLFGKGTGAATRAAGGSIFGNVLGGAATSTAAGGLGSKAGDLLKKIPGLSTVGGKVAGSKLGSSIISGLGNVLKTGIGRMGLLGLGVTAATEVWKGFEDRSKESSEDLHTRIKGFMEQSIGNLEIGSGSILGKLGVGQGEAEAAEDLNKAMRTVVTNQRTLTKEQAETLRGRMSELNFTEKQRKVMQQIIGQGRMRAKITPERLADTGAGQLRKTIRQAEEAGAAISRAQVKAWVKSGKISVEEGARILTQIKKVDEKAEASTRKGWVTKGLGFGRGMAVDNKITKNEIQQLEGQLRLVPEKYQKSAGAATIAWAKEERKKGTITKQELEQIKQSVEAGAGKITATQVKHQQDLVQKTRQNYGTVSSITGNKTQEAAEAATKNANDLARGVGKGYQRAEVDSGKSTEKMKKETDRDTKDAADQGTKHSKDFARDFGGNYRRTQEAASEALVNIQDDTNKALKGLGGKPMNFGIKAPSSSEVEALHGTNQRGGQIAQFAKGGLAATVPGVSPGDTHTLSIDGIPHAKVEAKEGVFVGNRELMKRMHKANKDVPRFATGGGLDFALGPYDIPPVQYDAAHAGDNSHLHVSGTTVDWVIAIGKQLQQMGWTVGEFSGPASAGFGPVTVQHQSHGGGGLGGAGFAGAAIDANTAAQETRAEVAAAARILGGAGIAGAVVERIKKQIIEGPDGPLKDIAQSSVDKVTKAANDYIAKHMPSDTGVGLLTGSGDVEKIFADTAKKLSTSKTATLALGEAGYAESGMQDLPGGDASSQGALQLLASTASGMGIDPHDEAAVSSAFLLRGYYGRGGANKLAEQGLSAQMVAQSVQGSAFPTGSNYAAQESSARAWMSRYGLQFGGMLQMLAGGGHLVGNLPNYGALMDLLHGTAEHRDEDLDKWLEKLTEYDLNEGLGKDITSFEADVPLLNEFADKAHEATRSGFTEERMAKWMALSDKAMLDADNYDVASQMDLEGLPKATQDALKSLRDDADTFGENAGRAAALESSGLFSTMSGKPSPGVQGQDELYWLNQQLQKLFELRNALISAQVGPFYTPGVVEDKTTPEWLQQQLETTWAYRNELITGLHDRDAMFKRGDYDPGKEWGRKEDLDWWKEGMERLWKLRNRVAEAVELLEKARQQTHDLLRDLERKYAQLGRDIAHDESDLEAYQNELDRESTSNARKKKLREDLIPALEEKIRKGKVVYGLLGGRVIPAVEQKDTGFHDRKAAMLEKLDGIQGPGNSLRVKDDKNIPDNYRELGGQLYEQGQLVSDSVDEKTQAIYDSITDLIPDISSVQGPGITAALDLKADEVTVKGDNRWVAEFAHRPKVKGEIAALDRDIATLAKDTADMQTTGAEAVLDDLRGVQGSGVTMDILSALPSLGVLGGEIFDTQLAIATKGGIPEATDKEALLKEQLLAQQQQNIVLISQMPVFERFASLPAFGGEFAKGGIVPGMIGEPRTVIAHGGEAIGQPGEVVVNVIVEKGAGVDAEKIKVEVDHALKQDRNRARRMIGRT